MSDTKRKIVRHKKKNNPHSKYDSGYLDMAEVVEVDDTQAKYQKTRTRKMTPYSKKGEPKFEAETGSHNRLSREAITNANRSLKKSERMRLKKETKEKYLEFLAEQAQELNLGYE
jgi:hypothetical protein